MASLLERLREALSPDYEVERELGFLSEDPVLRAKPRVLR